jgi:hypothetical protein
LKRWRWIGLSLLPLASCSVGARAQAAPTIYFPPNVTEVVPDCRTRELKRVPVDDFLKRWFSKHLRAANEPSLADAARRRLARGEEWLRFTFLRSFHHPLIVRVEKRSDGSAWLFATELSGAGGYEPGSIKRRFSRPLKAAEMHRLVLLHTAVSFAEARLARCTGGLDGSEWIIEAASAGRYRYINRWSPREGAVRRIGLYLLGLTGWQIAPIY